jgi:uncharacterized membrane protein YdjX (TVP38/TMEM64 family)
MNKNLKTYLAVVYFICLSLVFYAFFTFLDFNELKNYSYIREKSLFLIEFKNNHLFVFSFFFFLFTIAWVLMLGFGTPVALVAGFIFGKFYGTVISVLGFAIGSTLLYFLARVYFRQFIIKCLSEKISKFKGFFNKNEFLYFLLFRFAGGGGIPFPIQNVLPVIFDMKIKNYFYSTFLGLTPTIFIINSIGSGIEGIIDLQENPSFTDILLKSEIYLPLMGFIILLIISYLIKTKIFKIR